MARPKGSINKAKDAQGVEEAKITDTPLKGAPVEEVTKEVTTVKSVQVEEVKINGKLERHVKVKCWIGAGYRAPA